jgi:hypothetical protein
MDGPDLVYILGTGRSGSTLIGSILGEAAGAFCVGELRFLWERGFVENRFCGCGLRFHDCPVWSEIADRIDVTTDPARLAAISNRTLRVRHLPALLRGTVFDAPEVADLADHVRRAYRAVVDVTGARVLIDTSKSPAYAAFLEGAAVPVDAYLHLVRDPRAAAWSWARSRPSRALVGDAEPMDRFAPGKAAALWLLWNSMASLRFGSRGRYVLARYEDVVAAPRSQFDRLARSTGLVPPSDVFIGDDAVELGTNHTVAGNPGRRRSGPTVITDDGEWRHAMPFGARFEVSTVTLPLLHRYGYRARPSAA